MCSILLCPPILYISKYSPKRGSTSRGGSGGLALRRDIPSRDVSSVPILSGSDVWRDDWSFPMTTTGSDNRGSGCEFFDDWVTVWLSCVVGCCDVSQQKWLYTLLYLFLTAGRRYGRGKYNSHFFLTLTFRKRYTDIHSHSTVFAGGYGGGMGGGYSDYGGMGGGMGMGYGGGGVSSTRFARAQHNWDPTILTSFFLFGVTIVWRLRP